MTTVNFDGMGHEVDPVIASLIAADRKKYDSQIDVLNSEKESLNQRLTEIQGELDKASGELEAANTKLEEAQKVDHSGEISARLDAWQEVLPSIRNKEPQFDADYNYSVPQIQRTFLEKVRGFSNLDSKPDNYIGGMYEGLKPNEKADAIDKVNGQLRQLNNNQNYDGSSQLEKARRKAIERKENAYKQEVK